MTKQRKINSTYAIVMVIGLAFMLLFGYLVKPFSTVTVTDVICYERGIRNRP